MQCWSWAIDRLTREEQDLNTEVKEMLRVSADISALTGEKRAKHKWIEGRLGEIEMWKRQLSRKLTKVRREG